MRGARLRALRFLGAFCGGGFLARKWMNGWMDGEGGSREEEWQGKRGVDGLVLMGSLGSR